MVGEPRPKQKPIHYSLFIIIGFIMVALSKLVLYKGTTEHVAAMQLFFYIGLIFLGVGTIKLLIHLKKEGKFKSEEHFAESLAGRDAKVIGRDSRDRARYEQQLERRREPQAQSGKPQPKIILCPVCGTKNYSTSNYCHMCGAKLK